MVANLIMSIKLATLGLLKIKVSGSKGYDIQYFKGSINDVTNISSCHSNYTVDVVMGSKFGNY